MRGTYTIQNCLCTWHPAQHTKKTLHEIALTQGLSIGTFDKNREVTGTVIMV
ncbi:hypothetical protein GCM10028778_12320 [Barrientosiimonas marina]